MRDLISGVFAAAFGAAEASHDRALHDSALLNVENPEGAGLQLAMTTDAYVVRPMFFPGGNIGEIAVYGTVNDLAMGGAEPKWLSAAFIIEEGLEMETLLRVVEAMRDAAIATGISIMTGDTKVVERGRGDGLFITTSGVGVVRSPIPIGPQSIAEDDAVLLSGDIGRHGIAVMAARESLALQTEILSDCAPVSTPALAMLEAGIEVHCMRDLTRGGLASALVEIAEDASLQITVDERAIRIRPEVASACELMGFDPLHVANEGRFVSFVASHDAERALEILRRYDVARDAVRIGTVTRASNGHVLIKTIGGLRPVDMLSGELLPRIC